MAETRDALDAWSRKWRTLWVWSQLYLGYKAAQARGRLLPGDQRQLFWEETHDHMAEKMWSNIAELRGWWVKVGQFLSTRSDLLPTQYIHHLTKLQDMMPTSNYSIIKKIVEKELDQSIEDLFETFEEEAMASASIGQVHKAILKTGEKVVVKVQHPGVDKILYQDMLTLGQMTWAFGMLEKGLNFTPILDEWQTAAANELDFRVELEFQERARLAADESKIDVIIPRCYRDLTTKKVMVMEYIEGFKITDHQKLKIISAMFNNNADPKEHRVDPDTLMTKVCESFAYQIHIDGMFNGDPHPGNILVQINESTGEATPVLLDWGLVKCFTESERIAFAQTVFSIANMDVMGLMAAFEDMGFKFKSDSVIDPEIYMDALRIGFFRDTGSDIPIETETAADVVKESGISKQQVMEKNPIDDWPKNIIFFIRVASLLHGLCLQLNAKIPLLQILVNKAEQCLLERYKAPSPSIYVRYPAIPNGKARTAAEWRIHKFLVHLLERKKLLLGCQVAVVHDEKLIVDTCVGRMGPTNTRPVQCDSLFCPMTVCNGLLATALLKLVDTGDLNLDDPVCHFWDGFIRFGKESITVKQILTHHAGLHRALPKDLTLSRISNYDTMISILEDAEPSPPMAEEGGQYAYLSSGWAMSEIIRGVSNTSIDEFFRRNFIRKFQLTSEMFYPISDALIKSATLPPPPPPNPITLTTPKHKFESRLTTTTSDLPLSPRLLDSPLTTSQSKERISPTIDSKELVLHSPREEDNFSSISSPYLLLGDSSPRGKELPESKSLEDELKVVLRQQSITRRSPNPPNIEIDELNSFPYGQLTGHSNSLLNPTPPQISPKESDMQHQEPARFSSWLSNNNPQSGSTETKSFVPALDVVDVGKGRRKLSPNCDMSPSLSVSQQPSRANSPSKGSNVDKIGRASLSVLNRFTSSRREIGIARISNEEVMEKLEAAKQATKEHNKEKATQSRRFRSKFLHLLQTKKLTDNDERRGSAIELAKLKPHVLDPLVYDSKRFYPLLIPPTNCRTTARALARFYNHLASGKILSTKLLNEASKVETIDQSLDTLVLTGGGSRQWGLGYQLYSCLKLENQTDSIDTGPPCGSRRVSFRNEEKLDDQQKVVVGLGHGDMGGSIALCFPQLKLSIAILLNDILTGPLASREILKFILNIFNLQPNWDIPYSPDGLIKDVENVIKEKVKARYPSTAALKQQKQFYISQVIPPSKDLPDDFS